VRRFWERVKDNTRSGLPQTPYRNLIYARLRKRCLTAGRLEHQGLRCRKSIQLLIRK
jgi:hypothetical protein